MIDADRLLAKVLESPDDEFANYPDAEPDMPDMGNFTFSFPT